MLPFPFPNEPATGGSATERAIQAIVSHIKQHQLTEGDLLPTVDALCRETGFSRVIVREALSYLKGMGIIETRRGSGCRLAKIRPLESFANLLPFFFSIAKDLRDVTELRTALELGAFPQIVANIMAADLEEMRNILDEADRLLEGDDFQNIDFIRLDLAFHCLLARASRIHILEIVTQAYFKESLNLTLFAHRVEPVHLEEFRRANLEHRAIYDSLKLGAREMGFLALHQHLAPNLNRFGKDAKAPEKS